MQWSWVQDLHQEETMEVGKRGAWEVSLDRFRELGLLVRLWRIKEEGESKEIPQVFDS